MEQGIDLSRYMLIPRTLIFLTRGEEVLLLRGSAQKRLYANRYNGIGGHIEPGEDVVSAARRELYEEARLQPDTLYLCGTVIIDTGQNPGIGLYVLCGECSQGEPLPSAEGKPEWIARQKLGEYPLVEDLFTLLPKVLDMRPEDQPFSALYWYDAEGKMQIQFNENQ